MRIASISVVKNESDIIESFVRYNLQHLDHMYIIDHNSADSTAAIINKLIGEKLPISLSRDTQPEHKQAQRLTELARILPRHAKKISCCRWTRTNSSYSKTGCPGWRPGYQQRVIRLF